MLPVFGVGDIFPVLSGGQKAAYCLYGALNRYMACRYVFLDPQFDGIETGVYPNGLSYARVGGRAARSGINSLAVHKLVYRDGPTRNILRTARTRLIVEPLRAFALDAPAMVITSFPWPWAVLEPCAQGKLVVYDSYNFEYHLGQERLAAGKLDRRSLQVQLALERGLSRRADILLACSQADAQAYAKEFGVDSSKIHTGFKGASVPEELPRRKPVADKVALFVGSDWPANNEAALLIVRQIAPRLPQVRFRIVGGCSRVLPGELPGNVSVAGFVEDLKTELDAATVALNPMRSGSGINMKLLEYLAVGIPVVSTEFGMRGLEGGALAAVKVATPESFPAAIEALTSDLATMESMRQLGHAYARRHLDWDAIARRFAGMMTPYIQA